MQACSRVVRYAFALTGLLFFIGGATAQRLNIAAVSAANNFADAQATIPTPESVLGFVPGDDRKLASWQQVVAYFQKLDAASDRVNFAEIGKTTLGAPFVYATISAPENLKNLEKYKQINAKLADPRTFKSDDKAAQELIRQGKTIVLITCGIHSTEVGGYLSSMLIAHRLASSNEPEIQKILNETIILLVPSLNPDGVDIVKNWYDKTLGTPYEGTNPPELYHKYTGHDNNRDWYAFTQVETQLTVDKIHNVWHPQIVHDIHQQGAYGARLFLPPYMQPVEPNVPQEIVAGYTELGNYMAKDLRAQGFQGITTDSTYDAWTPARAYSHYHGGVRILSETASANLATPITVKFENLRGAEGYDAKIEAPNFSPVWKGGEWHLRDITNYMTTAAFSLLNHAANNRAAWLNRFYAIGKEAVRPRKKGEVFGYLIGTSDSHEENEGRLLHILQSGDVEVRFTRKGFFVPIDQPYGMFAKALLERQRYPNLLDSSGHPIAPYDVTAHTLPLLMDVKVSSVYASQPLKQIGSGRGYNGGCGGGVPPRRGVYRSYSASIDEGWTRWTLETESRCIYYLSLQDKELRDGNLRVKFDYIVIPDQSANQILNGFPKGSMPDEYTGGVGKEGVANLWKFVEDGGTLVFLNRASDFAIEQFGLPLRDVTRGLPRKDFYIPGSILRTELDTAHPLAKGMPKDSIAWFEESPAFEVTEAAGAADVKIIARYPSDPKAVLLSGWALGAEKIAGKAALVEIKLGKGKIILFGFRPQYRGQSLATFPLFFNAIQ